MAGSFRTGNSNLDTDTNSPIFGGGEMGNRIRTFDWSSTPLGPISHWQQSLRTAVNILLQSPAPLVILWGAEGITLYNNGYINFAGARHPALLGASCEAVWPEAAEFIQHVKTQCLRGASLSFKNHPHRVYRNNRPEDIWMDLYCSPLPDDRGQPAGVFIVNIETTDWTRATQALKESEERFRSMADASGILIAQADITKNVIYMNQAWSTFTGRSMEELINYGWANFFHPEDSQAFVDAYHIAFENRASFTREFRLLNHSGEYFWHLAVLSPFFGPNGTFSGYISSCIDISERKQAEKEVGLKNEQLIRINNDLDNFIYTASHDLRSPILNLEGLLVALNKRLAELMTPGAATLLHMMDQSIEKLKRTIKDLTEITKAQKGLEDSREKVHFKELLDEITADLQEEIQQVDPLIEENFEVASVDFSRGNIRSILYNLLTNALKYRAADRRLTIEIGTYAEAGFVVLSVRDNGLGISEQQLPKLFTMFKRMHTHVEGTGIGLYIIKRIVENKGGRIDVESEVNGGSHFKVYLPIHA